MKKNGSFLATCRTDFNLKYLQELKFNQLKSCNKESAQLCLFRITILFKMLGLRMRRGAPTRHLSKMIGISLELCMNHSRKSLASDHIVNT